MGSIQRPEATLEERWDVRGASVLLTGIQALVRLPLLQREMDQAAGFDTAGFIAGYRGSRSAAMTRNWRSRRRGWPSTTLSCGRG